MAAEDHPGAIMASMVTRRHSPHLEPLVWCTCEAGGYQQQSGGHGGSNAASLSSGTAPGIPKEDERRFDGGIWQSAIETEGGRGGG